jgi:hypothetical protein
MLSHLYAARHALIQQAHNINQQKNDTPLNSDTGQYLLWLTRTESSINSALHSVEVAIGEAKKHNIYPLVPPAPADINLDDADSLKFFSGKTGKQ